MDKQPAKRMKLQTRLEIQDQLNIGRNLFYRLRKEGIIEEPVRLGKNCTRYKEGTAERAVERLSKLQ